MSWNLSERIVQGWLDECRLAAESDEVFPAFRRLPNITYVTENWHGHHVHELWSLAWAAWPAIESFLPELARRDKLGWAFHDDAAMIGNSWLTGCTANSALRAAQIKQLFGDQEFRIAEIGGGYGNLANVLHVTGCVASYTGFDLYEPSVLQKKYLGRQGWSIEWPALHQYDLAISCFSLSELDDEGRDDYGRQVLSRSSRGFHVWNWGREGYDIPDREQEDLQWLRGYAPGAHLLPRLLDREAIYVWGDT